MDNKDQAQSSASQGGGGNSGSGQLSAEQRVQKKDDG